MVATFPVINRELYENEKSNLEIDVYAIGGLSEVPCGSSKRHIPALGENTTEKPPCGFLLLQ